MSGHRGIANMPGIGGSLGMCALCGDTFIAEILTGQRVQTVEIEGFDRDVCLHRKCLLVLSRNGPDWRTLPEGPLRRAYAEADTAQGETPMPLIDRARRHQAQTEDAADVHRLTERRPMRGVAIPADLFPTRYRCVQCRVEKDGRFTHHKHASGHGWDQGHQIGNWICWDCLPKGQGRGE